MFSKETFFPGAGDFIELFDRHWRTDTDTTRQANFQKVQDSADCLFIIRAQPFVFDVEGLDADALEEAIPNFLLLLALA